MKFTYKGSESAVLSEHAQEEMQRANISLEDVRECLEHGELRATRGIKGERRYVNELDTQERTMVVVYTYREDYTRIITVYPLRRKKEWLK